MVMIKIQMLFDLQVVDLELDKHNQRLLTIATSLHAGSGLTNVYAKVAELKENLRRSVNQQRDLEDAVTRQTERVDQTEAKLYSGSIKNPRELEDLQADVTQLKTQLSGVEDLLLEALERVDDFQSSLQKAEITLKEKESIWHKNEASLIGEQSKLSVEVDTLSDNRNVMSKKIDPITLTLYEQIRTAHNGIAVAHVQRDRCVACQITLPNRQLQELRKAESPIRCNNCGRILLVN